MRNSKANSKKNWYNIQHHIRIYIQHTIRSIRYTIPKKYSKIFIFKYIHILYIFVLTNININYNALFIYLNYN